MKSNCLFLILAVVMGVFPPMAPLAAQTVTDQLGRKVELPDDPQRVVALAPSITEIIFALGQAHLLKGVTQFSDFPPAAEKLPQVGSYVRLDLEKIVALKPDLCIAIKDGNPREAVQRLESLKIPVYVVDPRGLDSVMQTIQEIGGLLHAGARAASLIEDMQSRILRVKSLIAKTDLRPRVFFQIGIAPIVSVGSDTFIHELIVLAGGKNLAEGSASYPRFSREQVMGLAPEIFIITTMERSALFDKVKAEWSRWPNLPAVQNDRIFLVDSNLFDRPSPRLADALELLAQLIHPEIFEPETFKHPTTEEKR
ncbi:MAG: cobalamin-binding protein [Desulfobacterales bacterium]|nr:MAG: cobalamin-binding protein [Desulfobacterales bacterium]